MTTRNDLSTRGPQTATNGSPARQDLPHDQNPPRPNALTSLGLVTILLGASLPMVDFFIVNVALPTIDTTLHASPATLELVVAGYGIAYAVLLVLGGRLGDAFGRRRMFLIGLASFTIASLACGLAPTPMTLVLARVVQGAAAAMTQPQVLSTIQATTGGTRRSRAIGLYAAVGGISATVGQVLGGLLVSANIDGLSWRPIFLVNVPIGIVALLLAMRAMPNTRSSQPAGVDNLGTGLFGLTLLALMVPLTEGSSLGWPVWTWLLLAAVPVLAAGFVVVERRVERAGRVPLLPPSIMRMPSMRRGLPVAVPFFLAFGGFMFCYAVTLQDGIGLGALESGIALAPMSVGFFASSLLSGRLVARLGARAVSVGAILQAVGIGAVIVGTLIGWPHLTIVDLTPGMLIAGIGQGFTMTTLVRLIVGSVPVERAGVGSGVMVTAQQSSLALGVATLGTLFTGLAAVPAWGMRDAFVLVLSVMAAIAVLIAIAGRRLPDPLG
jgi:MFS family permease